MKNSIKLFLLIILNTFNCKSQTIIVRGENNGILPQGFKNTGQYYYKDIHNYLDNFTGTWEYVNGNEKFQIILAKIIKHHTNMPNIKLNFYEDGIAISYKKYVNGNLVYTSPVTNMPTLSTNDGEKLEGYMTDYGRVTVQVDWPTIANLGVRLEGGINFRPDCIIEKMPPLPKQPERIKFKLYLKSITGHMGDAHNNPAYNGLPKFSIPNMVVMKKVP
ncbi:hypothetical protein OF897_18840 [Chryseobacterium formosus]|uniref:DUF6705 domain-containing protein n=1 Tax=Chryseobacterium formosus TaxID=1537363 RepID=A0ABT3XWG3_9FLAO|nr:DUF6705 family protein [Chryseobacterium formosus]MCX8525975.1 hypothetical protein [Chryseobacterium formosus]